MHGWPSTRAEVITEIQPHWSFRDEVVVKEGVTMKGGRIINPESLLKRALGQLHVNHIGTEKIGLLV